MLLGLGLSSSESPNKQYRKADLKLNTLISNSSWLIVELLCVKVVGATSSEGFTWAKEVVMLPHRFLFVA